MSGVLQDNNKDEKEIPKPESEKDKKKPEAEKEMDEAEMGMPQHNIPSDKDNKAESKEALQEEPGLMYRPKMYKLGYYFGKFIAGPAARLTTKAAVGAVTLPVRAVAGVFRAAFKNPEAEPVIQAPAEQQVVAQAMAEPVDEPTAKEPTAKEPAPQPVEKAPEMKQEEPVKADKPFRIHMTQNELEIREGLKKAEEPVAADKEPAKEKVIKDKEIKEKVIEDRTLDVFKK